MHIEKFVHSCLRLTVGADALLFDPGKFGFIDGRVDLYRDRIFEDHLHIAALLPGWQDLLKRYRVNAVIVRSGSPLDGALAADEHWTLGYRDPLAVVYTTAMEAGGPAEAVQAAPATLSKHL